MCTSLKSLWDGSDKYYLRPIPLNQKALNPNLGQNPGWEE